MIDILGIELLNQKLQQTIQDIKIESFIFNATVTEVNSVYLKFDTWIDLFFDDGVFVVKEGLCEKQRIIESGGDRIEYKYLDSVTHLIDIEKIRDKRFINFVKEKNELRLVFDNDSELVMREGILVFGKFGQMVITIK